MYIDICQRGKAGNCDTVVVDISLTKEEQGRYRVLVFVIKE